MPTHLPMICLVAALATLAGLTRPVLAQELRHASPGTAAGGPLSTPIQAPIQAPIAAPVPARGHDKVWSTQPWTAPAPVPPAGVVVMTPNVVLGWGGLPPGGPGPRPVPGSPGARPVPGVPGAGTLHHWRSP